MTESIFDAIGHNFLVGAPSDSSKTSFRSHFKNRNCSYIYYTFSKGGEIHGI